MELLRLSIDADGYTQPIVSMADPDDTFEVIDGFHRHRVGKECADIQSRVHGYLPLVQIRESQADKTDRMASTIRHNRARGKHRVEAMSDIVIELKKRNWSDEKISKNLGMEPDEVLRLCQISGIADLFADEDFSQSWDIDDFDLVDAPEEQV
jgi:ParB-like chromosome segregation protein Spo0J